MMRRAGIWAVVAGLVLPLIPLFLWSVARGWRFPDVLPPTFSLAPFAYAFSPVSGVVAALGTSILVAGITTALALLIGVPAGRALGLHQFRGRRVVEMVVLAPIVVPGIAVVLGLHGIFIRLGLTNTLAGVVLVHLIPVLPYVILVAAGVFANFDRGLEDQARSLGARPWRVMWHVTLPGVAAGMMVGALFAFLVSWSQYILTLVIGGGRVETLPLLLFSFASAGRNDIAGAIGVIYVLPGICVLILTARRITGQGAAWVVRP
jgi:putative spermidine/putrescine transport system permease protein